MFYRKVNVQLSMFVTLTAANAAAASATAANLVYDHLQLSMAHEQIQNWDYRLTVGRAVPYYPEEET
jgi:hypothetical protein